MPTAPDSSTSGRDQSERQASLPRVSKINWWRSAWSCPERLDIGKIWPLLFVIVVVLLFYRLPEAILDANFYAEDGCIFFKQQYEQGFASALFTHYAGYLHFTPRIVAAVCALLPLEYVPCAYSVCCLLIAAAVFTFFFAPGFRPVVNNDLLRACIVIIFTLMPNADSLMKLAYVNWYMVTFIALLTLYELPAGTLARIFLFVLGAVAAWSNPVPIVCLPVMAFRAWRARDIKERLWWLGLATAVIGYALTEEHPPSLLPTLAQDQNGKLALIHALGFRVFHFFFLGQYLSYPWPDEGWKVMTAVSMFLASLCAAAAVLAYFRKPSQGGQRYVPLALFYLILSTSAMFVLRTGGWHFFLDWNADSWDGNGRFFYCSVLLLCVLGGVFYERVLRDWTAARAWRRGTVVIVLLCWLAFHQLGYRMRAWHSQASWSQSCREILAAEARVRKTGGSEIVHVRTALFGFDFDLAVKPPSRAAQNGAS